MRPQVPAPGGALEVGQVVCGVRQRCHDGKGYRIGSQAAVQDDTEISINHLGLLREHRAGLRSALGSVPAVRLPGGRQGRHRAVAGAGTGVRVGLAGTHGGADAGPAGRRAARAGRDRQRAVADRLLHDAAKGGGRHQRAEPRPGGGRRRCHRAGSKRPALLRAGVAGAGRRAGGRADRRSRGRGRPPLPDRPAPLPRSRALRARGARPRRTRPGRGVRLANALRPDHVHHRGAVRRGRRAPAAHHRPAAGLRARFPPRRATGGAGHALRRAGGTGARARPLLRLAGRRPARERPPAQLRRRPDAADAPRQRAGRPRCAGDARAGRGALPAGTALVPREGRDDGTGRAGAGRPVRAARRGPPGRLRRGPLAGRRRLRRLLAGGGARSRRPSSPSSASTPSPGPGSAAGRSAHRSPRTPPPT